MILINGSEISELIALAIFVVMLSVVFYLLLLPRKQT